jgi:hypothetical protein
VFGYVIALGTSSTTRDGFMLRGGDALLLFGVMIAYFWLGNSWLGGTVGRRLLRIAPSRSGYDRP